MLVRLGIEIRVELLAFRAEEKPQTVNTQNRAKRKEWEHHDGSNYSVHSRSPSPFQHLPAGHRGRKNADDSQHPVEDNREDSTEDSYARVRVVSCLFGKSDSERDEHTGRHNQQQHESEEKNRGKRAKAYCQNLVVVGTSHRRVAN